eukprot:TRINITY_DN887_c0_g1_i6.p1 TRINITY_DN887_c0_g1~~TRINITY_DN887_c0_g1_i6.p1  ORF type:complete len:294 (-),score=95.29 TRINITY_DN887_c0_g1_i6:109-990(-)
MENEENDKNEQDSENELENDDGDIEEDEIEGDDTEQSKERTEERLARLKKFQKEAKKRGVVYISRIPPRMKPSHIRTLLQEYGEIKRIYLAPESEVALKARKKRGGSKRKLFTEGWVEFENKKVAKETALLLNGTPMGGNNKRSLWYSDLWSIKYLKKFKWYHLTEEIRQKKREADKKLRAQVEKAKREANAFLENRERAIVHSKIEERKNKKRSAEQMKDTDTDAGTTSKSNNRKRDDADVAAEEELMMDEEKGIFSLKDVEENPQKRMRFNQNQPQEKPLADDLDDDFLKR